MQNFLRQNANNLVFETDKFANQKTKIYFTDKISYSNTSSICRLVNYAF